MSEQSTGDQHIGLTRRRLVRETAVVGASAVPILAGTATAQTDAEGQSTDADGEDRETTLTAALPADAPTYGHDDYTGLFVQAGNRKGSVDPAGIDSCAFVASEDIETVWGYNAEMFERHEETQGGETTTLYALAENSSIGPDKRYIVNEPCGDYVEVELESLQTGNVSGPETATPGGAGATEATTPGFGVGAALGGVGTAIAGALAARGGDGGG